MMLTTALFARGEHSSPWIMSGIAFRMLTDLGLHHDLVSSVSENGPLKPMDLEIRRRVMWAAYGEQNGRNALPQLTSQSWTRR